MNARRRPTTLLFDLDGTLYPADHEYTRRMRTQVLEYMRCELGIENAEVVHKRIFGKYHQTIRGLGDEGIVIDDKAAYWKKVRRGTKQCLKPDEGVKKALASLSQRNKVVFTNTAEKEAREALDALGLSEELTHVYGANWMGDSCKPEELVYRMVLQHSGVAPKDCAMFEDNYANLKQAKTLGMSTIYVLNEGKNVEGNEDLSIFDAVVPALMENTLRTAAPWLWDD